MKYLSAIFFIIIISFPIHSCKRDFLKPQPLSFFAPDNIFVDEAGFEAGLVTVRRDLKPEFFGQYNPLNAELNGTDVGAVFYDADLTLLTPSSGGEFPILNMFQNYYVNIKNTNVIISRIDDIEWKSQTNRDAVLGEALFYRSYWYYRLIHAYGDVPWIGEEIKSSKLDFQTYSKWAILKKLQSDLEFCTASLPTARSKDRPSKYAALQLLSKVYMENLEFDKAISATTEIINGPFSLMKNRFGSEASNPGRNVVWDLHRPENKALAENLEGIFILINREEGPEGAKFKSFTMRNYEPEWWNNSVLDSEGKSGMLTSDVNGANTEQYDSLGRGNPNMNPSGWFNYTLWDDAVNSWKTTTDLRRIKGNYLDITDIKYNNPASVDYGKGIDIRNFRRPEDTLLLIYPLVWYKIKMPEPAGYTGDPMGGYGDWYVFRLAETYLLRAEAYFWKGQNNLAANDINEVRLRANALPITEGDVSIDFIFDERARELFIEEMRRTEMARASYIMARLNKDGYSVNSLSTKNWYYDRVMAKNEQFQVGDIGGNIFRMMPYNINWPIPITVITANTLAVMNQTEGYTGSGNNVPPIEEIP